PPPRHENLLRNDPDRGTCPGLARHSRLPRGGWGGVRKTFARLPWRAADGRFIPRTRFLAADAGHLVHGPAAQERRVPHRRRDEPRGGGDRPGPRGAEDPGLPEALRGRREVHPETHG